LRPDAAGDDAKVGNPETNDGGVGLAMKYQTSEWLPRPPLSTERIGLAGATANGHIYAIAGFAGNELFRSVEVRSRRRDPTWHPAPALTTPRGNCGADTVGHFVYVVGGLGEGDIALRSVERFDDRTNGPWQASRDLPKPRTHAGVAAHRKFLYVVGGADNGGTRSMVAYDVNDDRWIDRAPLPEPERFLLRLVTARDHLYAIGGFDGTTDRAHTLVDRYDPEHDRWERMAPLNEARGNCGVATFGRGRRHIVAVGGLDRFFGTSSRTSEVYDIEANEWEMLDVLLPHARASLVCALEDRNTVLAIGGGVEQDDGPGAAPGLVEALRIRVLGDDDDDQDEDEDEDQEDN
jgi:N-acetylneuraminic acid mutarotase